MLAPLRNAKRSRVAVGKSIPAPVEGWDAVSPLSSMKPERAIVLDNYFPQPGYVEIRKGYTAWTTAIGAHPVESLMVYNGVTAASNKMFAVCNGTFYDVTSSGAASATTVTGTTSNRWRYVNYTTSANVAYLWACSGFDSPKHWNGSVWATPAITVVTPSDIINVNVFKKRIWGCLANSLDACYLPLDSVAGAATKFPLGSVFNRGGYLVAMATWTFDGGLGPDDYAVFITSRGQVAIYSGTDPASDFLLKGVFNLGTPIGYKCFTKVGADVALISIDGVLPLSKALAVDQAAAATIAITQRINNAMNTAAKNYGSNFGWELLSYPRGTMAILNVPIAESVTQYQYVMNTLTGAWCRFTGWNFNCFAVFNDLLYAGGNDGTVKKCDYGAIDGSTTIDAQGQTAYNYFNDRGFQKRLVEMQPLITTDSDVVPSLGISTDYRDNATIGTPTAASTSSALYDSALYDTDLYASEGRASADWTTVSGLGQCASVHFRTSTSSTGQVIVQLNGFNIVYERGEFF